MAGTAHSELILVIADAAEERLFLAATIEHAGYRVLAAAEAEGGLVLARQQNPGLIVLALMGPGLEGWEACRRLKSDPLTARTPVILVTTAGPTRREERESRLDGALRRPVDGPALLSKVAELVERLPA